MILRRTLVGSSLPAHPTYPTRGGGAQVGPMAVPTVAAVVVVALWFASLLSTAAAAATATLASAAAATSTLASAAATVVAAAASASGAQAAAAAAVICESTIGAGADGPTCGGAPGSSLKRTKAAAVDRQPIVEELAAQGPGLTAVYSNEPLRDAPTANHKKAKKKAAKKKTTAKNDDAIVAAQHDSLEALFGGGGPKPDFVLPALPLTPDPNALQLTVDQVNRGLTVLQKDVVYHCRAPRGSPRHTADPQYNGTPCIAAAACDALLKRVAVGDESFGVWIAGATNTKGHGFPRFWFDTYRDALCWWVLTDGVAPLERIVHDLLQLLERHAVGDLQQLDAKLAAAATTTAAAAAANAPNQKAK